MKEEGVGKRRGRPKRILNGGIWMMVRFCRTHLLCRSMCNVADDETTPRLG